ncbi:MAG: nitroreductase family protein [Anaerolineae bacterium]|jgi:nitroreductase
MNAYEAIAKRKTIRDFEPREVSLDTVKKLLGAGLQAPSNNHLREWEFIIIQDKSKRAELLNQVIKPRSKGEATELVDSWGLSDELQREMYIEAIPRQFSMLMHAGCLILPCFRQRTPLLRPESLSSLNAFASVWCCIENILIVAASEGIFGVTRIPKEDERETLKRVLGVPEGYEIPCYLALGYPAQTATRTRQKSVLVEERIHVNEWSLSV